MNLALRVAGWELHLHVGPHKPPPPPAAPAAGDNGTDPGSTTSTAHQTGWRGDPHFFGFGPPDAY